MLAHPAAEGGQNWPCLFGSLSALRWRQDAVLAKMMNEQLRGAMGCHDRLAASEDVGGRGEAGLYVVEPEAVLEDPLGPACQQPDLFGNRRGTVTILGQPDSEVVVVRSKPAESVSDVPWFFTFGCVPGRGVGAVGKWPAGATAKSQAQAGHLSTAAVIVDLR